MPPTETPPNPAPVAPPPPSEPVKVVTRRFGELDHTELVHLLDSLEGDQAKSRFRESVYISIIVYLMLAWLAIYGPKYVFRQGVVVDSQAKIEKDKLAQAELDHELAKLEQPKMPKVVPKIDRKTMEQLQAMHKASEAAKSVPAPTPAPAPAPAPAPTKAVAPTPAPLPPSPPPLPSAPTPQAPLPRTPAPQTSAIPDAPRPNFSTPSTAGSSVSAAANAAVKSHLGGGAISGGNAPVGQGYGGSGLEILSDTQGVYFGDWLKKVLRMLKAAWYPLIPEECMPPLNKEGWTLIRFSVKANGQLDDMHLDGSTKDRAIDKAAWGAVTGVSQFPPLPSDYKLPTLELRVQFVISRNPPPDSQ